MAAEPVAIAEVVGFLHQFAPNRLEALQSLARTSDERELLKPGEVLGNGSATPSELKMKAALAATEEIRKAIQAAMPEAVTKLKSARRLNFWAGLATVLGSTAAVTTAIQEISLATQVAAGLAFVGALASEGRKFYLTSLGDGQRMGGAESAYTTLLESSVEADQLSSELDIALQTQDPEWPGLVAKANELAKRARMAIEALR